MGNHQFFNYEEKHIDREIQNREKINKLEELILKPQNNKNGIYSLTEKELEIYLNIDTKLLKKTEMNMKTIIICESTQEIIKANKERILQKIREKEKEEEENER